MIFEFLDKGVSKSESAYRVRYQLTSETQTLAGQAAKVVTYSYDANGNLLQQNGVNYAWDSHNHHISVSPASPAVGDKALVHSYDGHHRRVTRTVSVWAISGWQNIETTHFLYDGWNVIEEYTSALSSLPFTLTKTLTWGTDLSGSLQGTGGVGGLLQVTDHGSLITSHFFHYDGNGNVTQITDNSGASAATYRYDAFGNTLTATGPYAATNRYRFSNKPLDSEVLTAPLYYYGYRYYDPLTERWPSRDPIEERGGVNLYGFVGNDGVNKLDSLGMSPLWHIGYLAITCCNNCPEVLNNVRVLDEHGDGTKLLKIPSEKPDAEKPDGVYEVDVIYTPGIAHKIPGSTQFRSAVISCDCAKKTYELVLPNRWVFPVVPWKLGENRPQNWPGGKDAPQPYQTSPP